MKLVLCVAYLVLNDVAASPIYCLESWGIDTMALYTMFLVAHPPVWYVCVCVCVCVCVYFYAYVVTPYIYIEVYMCLWSRLSEGVISG